jgi:hypothetical protein
VEVLFNSTLLGREVMNTLGVDASIHADKLEKLTCFFVDALAKMLV